MDALLRGGDDLPTSLAMFAVAAVVVWIAGSRLAGYAARFATATGLGGALVGLVLLGGVTSLPEIATSATAAIGGSGALAANTLIGGVALQLLALAVVDVLVGRGALTATVPRPDVLAYTAMNIVMLMLVAIAVAAGEAELGGFAVGAGAILVAGAYLLCLRTAAAIGRGAGWRPTAYRPGHDGDKAPPPEAESAGLGRLLLLIAVTGAVILIAGYALARSGEAIARQTGLGESFFGAVFLAGATSLPEVSSATAAVRLKRPQMAIGDVLGGNMFNLSLILLVDVLYRPGPVLAGLGAFSVTAACLGALMCGLLLIGLVERRDRTILRMGYDSVGMLLTYGIGLAVLYRLKDAAAG
ncbi:MAG: hypothetical protein Q8Q88_17410 [Phenylobacterium sp.]|uniref:sodium:calcium antiporter n=1 Tax=Phenylobacterium sp. TaxID=1871053 RepID=UPI002734AFCF|nr:hypothetical protein [Phenylobacterium sp.]MDP3748819.1 hypothetical protein [Phenylobacterium sp.]